MRHRNVQSGGGEAGKKYRTNLTLYPALSKPPVSGVRLVQEMIASQPYVHSWVGTALLWLVILPCWGSFEPGMSAQCRATDAGSHPARFSAARSHGNCLSSRATASAAVGPGAAHSATAGGTGIRARRARRAR